MVAHWQEVTTRSTTTNMKRQRCGRRLDRRNGHICWTTALLVGIATLQSIGTIEYGESFVFAPPLSKTASTIRYGQKAQHKTEPLWRRPRSIGLGLGAAKLENETILRGLESEKSSNAEKHMTYLVNDHDLLTKKEEYELGCKIQKFVKIKNQIDEMVMAKKIEQEKRLEANQRRREKEAARRRKRRNQAGELAFDIGSADSLLHSDDLSMEEELEEFLSSKGLSEKTDSSRFNRRSEFRNEVQDLYDDFEDDEQAMMEELGMHVYGIDNYNDNESSSDDLAIVDYHDSDYALEDEFAAFPDPPKKSDSSKLGDTLDAVRMLTELEIKDELGVTGGQKELVKILIQGTLAKQKMMRCNVRLVTSIAKKWMLAAKGSGAGNTEGAKKLSKSMFLGDWSTPAIEEVIQQGIVGLALAIERFEPERELKFSTYATYYITNEVRQIFQSATTQCLYVPPYFYNIKNKYEKIVRDHYYETKGDPNQKLSLEKIAAKLDLKPPRLHFILRSTRALVQLDAPAGGTFTSPGKGGGSDPQRDDPVMNTIAR